MDDKRDKLRTLLLDISAEQMQEYYNFGAALQLLNYDMRVRFVEYLISGQEPFKGDMVDTLIDKFSQWREYQKLIKDNGERKASEPHRTENTG